MNDQSSIFGISVRALLSLITVGSGLGFLYVAAFTFAEGDLRLAIIQAVVGFINLSLGFYLGQKTTERDIESEVEARVETRLAEQARLVAARQPTEDGS